MDKYHDGETFYLIIMIYFGNVLFFTLGFVIFIGCCNAESGVKGFGKGIMIAHRVAMIAMTLFIFTKLLEIQAITDKNYESLDSTESVDCSDEWSIFDKEVPLQSLDESTESIKNCFMYISTSLGFMFIEFWCVFLIKCTNDCECCKFNEQSCGLKIISKEMFSYLKYYRVFN